jgi:hypothetical protein
MLLKPLPAVRGAEPVLSPSMEKPGDRLESAEALLRENARRAEERTSWKRHLIGIAANLMGGAAIVAFGDTSDAVVSTLTGIAISEAAIWSQPKRAIDDLEDYENRFQRRHAVGRPSWQVSPILAGAVIIVRF